MVSTDYTFRAFDRVEGRFATHGAPNLQGLAVPLSPANFHQLCFTKFEDSHQSSDISSRAPNPRNCRAHGVASECACGCLPTDSDDRRGWRHNKGGAEASVR